MSDNPGMAEEPLDDFMAQGGHRESRDLPAPPSPNEPLNDSEGFAFGRTADAIERDLARLAGDPPSSDEIDPLDDSTDRWKRELLVLQEIMRLCSYLPRWSSRRRTIEDAASARIGELSDAE